MRIQVEPGGHYWPFSVHFSKMADKKYQTGHIQIYVYVQVANQIHTDMTKWLTNFFFCPAYCRLRVDYVQPPFPCANCLFQLSLMDSFNRNGQGRNDSISVISAIFISSYQQSKYVWSLMSFLYRECRSLEERCPLLLPSLVHWTTKFTSNIKGDLLKWPHREVPTSCTYVCTYVFTL